VKRWAVYKMIALEPPRDLVQSMGQHWTRRGAERHRRHLGPDLREFMLTEPLHGGPDEPHYFVVMRLSRRRCRWRRP
jgi:hypothetical protein